MISTSRILISIVKICFDSQKWDLLNENLKALTKRRNQLKQAITNLIQEVCTYVDKIENQQIKLKLIDTIREATAGKLYVEVERARLTKILADVKEKQGNLKDAHEILQDVQIETLGSMDKREKFEFILEQMRLCLLNKDFLRMQIISRKISSKALHDPNFQDLKLKFYELMIQLDQNEKSYFTICQHFKAIYDLTEIQNNETEALIILANIVVYLILSPYSLEQVDMINRIRQDKKMDKLPLYKILIKWFLTQEIINYKDFLVTFEKEIKATPSFRTVPSCFSNLDRWQVDLINRINEHNIRIMSIYYQRINLLRMSELLNMTPEECEEILRNLVVSKIIHAKMDRIKNIITFHQIKNQSPEDILNEWSHNNDALMNLVNKANHIINKEFMMRKIKTPSIAA
ncbi:26S proteasome non-ATPase regulatory subunit 12-like isoform X2 [Gordionus sp. m RMFG-2023]